MKFTTVLILATILKVNALLGSEFSIDKIESVAFSHAKRTNDFYEKDENFGQYLYNEKTLKRTNDFYEKEKNLRQYPQNLKKRYENLETQTSYELTGTNTNSRRFKSLLLSKRLTDSPKNSEFVNITRCEFQTKSSVLSCFNSLIQNTSIDCQASFNQSDLSQFNFDQFGIEIQTTDLTEKRFNLYPFKISNETQERVFYNYQIRVNENNIDLSLFHSSNTTFLPTGMNVEDSACFDDLADLLVKSAEFKTVDFKISSKDILTKIVFIGEIFVDQKPGMIPKSNQKSL